MKPRSLALPAVVAGIGIALIVCQQQPPQGERAVADPSVAAPLLVEPQPQPQPQPAVAVARTTPNPVGKPQKLLPPNPSADHTDPWTGEDLAPEVEQIVVARSLPVDRVDPWNPSTIYPSLPSPDINLDPIDPWTQAHETTPVRVAKKAEPKRLSHEDPWISL